MFKKTVLGSSLALLLVTGTPFVTQADINDKDCGDFSSQQEVMEFWYANGFNATNDPHRLDGDDDGLACEVSQSEYNNFLVSKKANESSTDIAKVEVVDGEKLPDTASNNPLMMLFGAGIAGLGSLLLFRRKSQQA
ncbi:LPXTG cell wall anchor domain-containing protein [Planococcus glaciei]|uniref:LPXTG cell wall anchor domain-containing protein n=1 Tax=Planococcus glaciei TaxID=459472 RepID=A0A7H8QBJ3_9BACL|nr:excalibur calcium-binding domain-containing protein [Planococcus glaciei]ETP69455.1 hypothetical protein G159_07160 [Planococcus glaciei CHR43]QKX51239.1 LPXTG cell wall anchor domain-containing protein [Planococcus glaciei]